MRVSVETGAAEKMGYRPGLDVLRAVAVSLVIVAHMVEWPWRFGGRVGVSMFLTLSGFLITRLLLEERAATGEVSRRRFYRRRAARLLPALPLVLLACSLVNAWQGFPIAAPLATSIFYVQNIRVGLGHDGDAFNHLWSLALEEQFYVLWPLAFAAFPVARLRRVALWSIPAFLAMRLVADGSEVGDFLFRSGFSRVDGLLVGCGLALWFDRFPVPSRSLVVAAWAVVLGLSVGGGSMMWFATTFGLTVLPLATCVLVLAAIHQVTAPAPLVGLGKISYGVYLWHVPVLWWLLHSHGVLAVLLVTLWVSVVSYRFIEQPARRLIDHRQPIRRWCDARTSTTTPTR